MAKVTRKEHGNAAYLAAWKAANPDKDKAYQTKYRETNREKTRKAVLKCVTRHRKHTTSALSAYKVARGCVDCGYNAHSEALDFDHLPGKGKRLCISAMRSLSMSIILSEVEKCEIVCANCHRVRTAARRAANRVGNPSNVKP